MTIPNIIPADVLALAPELTSKITDGAWVYILKYCNEFDLTSLGDTSSSTMDLWDPWNYSQVTGVTGATPQVARMARIYLAAHMATVTKRARARAAGPRTRQAVLARPR